MPNELELGFQLVILVMTGGLVILELTKPKQKPHHRKWRGR